MWEQRFTPVPAKASDHHHYSNLGYEALGYMLEDMLGKTLEQILRERVLDPMGMGLTESAVTNAVRPRMAVGYHFYNDFDTEPVVYEKVRTTYDGPLALATDYMVFSVTKDDIRVRMAVVDEEIWPLPSTRKKVVRTEEQLTYGEFTASGEVMLRDVLEQIWGEVNEKYGISAQLPPAESKRDGEAQKALTFWA